MRRDLRESARSSSIATRPTRPPSPIIPEQRSVPRRASTACAKSRLVVIVSLKSADSIRQRTFATARRDVQSPQTFGFGASRSRADHETSSELAERTLRAIRRSARRESLRAPQGADSASRAASRGVGSVEAREVFLDRGHDPPLLVQRRQRQRGMSSKRAADVEPIVVIAASAHEPRCSRCVEK